MISIFTVFWLLFLSPLSLFPAHTHTSHRTIERTPSSKSEPFVFIEIESVEIEYIGPKMAMVLGRHPQQRKLASDLDPEVALDRARN